MEALWISLAVVFVAELGDKSQLMALTFATRYPPWHVLAGITVAAALILGLSALAGAVVAVSLPTHVINVAAGLAFLGFAVWTLRGDGDGDGETGAGTRGRYPVVAVATAFVLAELGDKTMLATVTLASTEAVLPTWIGATAGMVAADGLAIVIGRQLGSRLPRRGLRIGAAVAFAVFGVLFLVEGVRG